MSYSTACDAQASGRLKGTGRKGNSQAGSAVKLFWSPSDFKFASKTEAVDIAEWNTAVAAGNLFYIGEISELDANDTDPTYYEAAIGNVRLKTAESKRVRQYRLVECACTHAALLSFDGQNGRLLIQTDKSYLKARMDSDGTVKGLKTSQFDVGIAVEATPETPAFTPIDVTFENARNDDEWAFEDLIDFTFDQVDQIFNAELKISNVSAGASLTFTVVATKDCSESPLTGLVAGDFKASDANGATLNITSVTPTANSYAFDVDTTDTSCVIEIDGVKTVSGTNYVSGEYTAST